MFPSDKVQALAYASGSKQLLSGSDEAILGIWNMDVKRIEVHKFIVCNCLSQHEKLITKSMFYTIPSNEEK